MKLFTGIIVMSLLGMPRMATESAMVAAAQNFLSTLDKDQHRAALLPVSSDERTHWGYVPGARKGVSWGEMTESQKSAARNLLKASLSKEGFEKIEAIRDLEPVLAVMEGGNKERDPGRYWFMFFGAPSSETPWLWRYEGHHISLTFSSLGSVTVASTPQFLGSNPAQVKATGARVLAKEQDLAFQLVESLSEAQKAKGVLSANAPNDIITGSSRRAAIEGKLGITYDNLTPSQQKLLRDLIQVHASVQVRSEQERRLKAIEREGYSSLVFAWLGPVERKGRHYYRIQSPSFVIEYDNTQADGNHIHTVWRDFKGDFGGDALAEHYQQAHCHEH